MLNISYDIFHVEYAWTDAEKGSIKLKHKNTRVTWFNLTTYVHREKTLKSYVFII